MPKLGSDREARGDDKSDEYEAEEEKGISDVSGSERK